MGIHKTRTTPYHPQSDGMVERFNRTLEGLLTITIRENQTDWDLKALWVASAYRATPHSSTGFTPNFIMWGREALLPMDVAYGLPSKEETIHEHLRNMLGNIREAHVIATEALHQSREVQKKYYDRGKIPYTYTPGEAVWCFLPMQSKGRSPKLQSFWTGPWEAKKKISLVVWEIQRGAKRRVVHVDLLKPYITEETESPVLAALRPKEIPSSFLRPAKETPPGDKRLKRSAGSKDIAASSTRTSHETIEEHSQLQFNRFKGIKEGRAGSKTKHPQDEQKRSTPVLRPAIDAPSGGKTNITFGGLALSANQEGGKYSRQPF